MLSKHDLSSLFKHLLAVNYSEDWPLLSFLMDEMMTEIFFMSPIPCYIYLHLQLEEVPRKQERNTYIHHSARVTKNPHNSV